MRRGEVNVAVRVVIKKALSQRPSIEAEDARCNVRSNDRSPRVRFSVRCCCLLSPGGRRGYLNPLVTSMCGAARASNIPSSRECRPTRGFRSADVAPGFYLVQRCSWQRRAAAASAPSVHCRRSRGGEPTNLRVFQHSVRHSSRSWSAPVTAVVATPPVGFRPSSTVPPAWSCRSFQRREVLLAYVIGLTDTNRSTSMENDDRGDRCQRPSRCIPCCVAFRLFLRQRPEGP